MDKDSRKEDNLCEEIIEDQSLRHYVKHAWRNSDPAQPFISDWHIEAMCDHIQAVYEIDPSRKKTNMSIFC